MSSRVRREEEDIKLSVLNLGASHAAARRDRPREKMRRRMLLLSHAMKNDQMKRERGREEPPRRDGTR